MITTIKWFWAGINFRKWTFEGCELANPLRIIWKIAMIIPVYAALTLFCLIMALYDLDYNSFMETWSNNT